MPQSTSHIDGEIKDMLPLGRRVLVQPHETPDYKGTIILPESVKTVIPTTGIIRALGFDLQDDENNRLEEGQTIVYGKYGGVELRMDNGKRWLIVHEDDILAIITRSDLLMAEKVA